MATIDLSYYGPNIVLKKGSGDLSCPDGVAWSLTLAATYPALLCGEEQRSCRGSASLAGSKATPGAVARSPGSLAHREAPARPRASGPSP